MIFLHNSEIGPINNELSINVAIPKGTLHMMVKSNPKYADETVIFDVVVSVDGTGSPPIVDYIIRKNVSDMKAFLTDIYCTLVLVYKSKSTRAIERITYRYIDYFIFSKYNSETKMFEFIAVPLTGIKMPERSIYDLLDSTRYTNFTISVSMKNYERLVNKFFEFIIMPVCMYNIAEGIVNKGGDDSD